MTGAWAWCRGVTVKVNASPVGAGKERGGEKETFWLGLWEQWYFPRKSGGATGKDIPGRGSGIRRSLETWQKLGLEVSVTGEGKAWKSLDFIILEPVRLCSWVSSKAETWANLPTEYRDGLRVGGGSEGCLSSPGEDDEVTRQRRLGCRWPWRAGMGGGKDDAWVGWVGGWCGLWGERILRSRNDWQKLGFVQTSPRTSK